MHIKGPCYCLEQIALLVNNKQSPLGINYLERQNSKGNHDVLIIVLPCRLHLQTQKPHHKKLPWIKKLRTPSGSFSKDGCSKHPAVEPQSFWAVEGSRYSTWWTNPHGVSFIKTIRGCFKERERSAASLTDSVSVRNLDATVLWKTKTKTKTKQKQKKKFWLKCLCEQSETTSV